MEEKRREDGKEGEGEEEGIDAQEAVESETGRMKRWQRS